MSRRNSKSAGRRKSVIRALFYLNALIWLGLAAYTFFGMVYVNNGLSAVMVAIFMVGNAFAMFLSGNMIGRGKKWAYYFGVFVLGINILLTFTDQFGLLDLLTFILDVVILGFLISTRKD